MVKFNEIQEDSSTTRILKYFDVDNFFDNILPLRLKEINEQNKNQTLEYQHVKVNNYGKTEHYINTFVLNKISDHIRFVINNACDIYVYTSSIRVLDTRINEILNLCDEIRYFLKFPNIVLIVSDLTITNDIFRYVEPRAICFDHPDNVFNTDMFNNLFENCEKNNIPIYVHPSQTNMLTGPNNVFYVDEYSLLRKHHDEF